MAQKKAHEVDRWLADSDEHISFILLYGPDRGLVSERARLFAQKSGLPLDDPFSVVRIDAGDVDQQGRLLDEARTVPMFADRRLVWLRGATAQAGLVADVTALLADPPEKCLILIEAGDLKKGSSLRTAIERAELAMALPCYADDARGLDSVIDSVFTEASLSLDLETRHFLKSHLGGDRLASRSELEKLALYCAGKSEVTVDDARAIMGDAAKLSSDETVDAIFCGRIAEFDALFSRYLAVGTPYPILAAALRQAQMLQLLREQVDRQDKTPSAAVAAARPPVFFARRRNVEQALQRWTQPRLQAAAERLQGAILKTRHHPALAGSLSRQALLALAIEGARAVR